MADSLLHLDISRLLTAHAVLSLVAALSASPIWNLPLALCGLSLASSSGNDDGGDALRTFSALFGGSFFLDFLWLVSNSTSSLAWFLLGINFLLKPVTLISALGSLRERGQATFSLPSNFSVPGMPGGFPPRQSQSGGGETLWSAPQQGSYHRTSADDYEVPRPQAQRSVPAPTAKESASPAYVPGPTSGGEGGGYHTLE